MIDRQRIRVLVADHDRWARLWVSDMLRESGFKVAEASNGMAALRAADADPPRIVLLGLDLPEISLADVAHTLRCDPRTRHTSIVQVRDFGNPIQLLKSVLTALEAPAPLSLSADKRKVRAEYTSAPKRARRRPSCSRVAPTLAPAIFAGARLSKR